ncbi:hypothetical protein MNBD_GAMMA16-1255 [hydrothermal vent metagenome]|uniref:Nitroreductase domain-containing protein n=1 Tax=hydrothermal vent metagenome TaxID=652676 RepID=A0A3B0ZHN7_9ZZZZ
MRISNNQKLDKLFIDRSSPYDFLSEPISEEDIETIFEAACWSPSCYNEQPWYFCYARQARELEKFRSTLVEANQAWANRAPLLIYIFSKKYFSQNGKLNRWAEFDTGAAWMALTFQANKLGLHTHAMGGFDADKAFEVTGIDRDRYDVICAVAVGKTSETSKDLKNRENLSLRKPMNEIVCESPRELIG